MGRPRQSKNHPPPRLTVARVVRHKLGLTLRVVSDLTTIPIYTLCRVERGAQRPNAVDLAALARVYGMPEDVLLREAVLVAPE